MRFYRFNFYNFIDAEFGNDVKIDAKRWSHTRIKIIKIMEEIRFLKECNKFKLLPQHLSRNFMKDISLHNHRSFSSFDNLRFKTSLKVLRIELADAHRHLRSLRHQDHILTHKLFRVIPVSILHNYFYKQDKYFYRVARREFIRLEKKFHWLVRNNSNPTSHVPQLSYYYYDPPHPVVNYYKLKLRSATNQPPEKPPPTCFALSPQNLPSSSTLSHIYINPASYKAPSPSVCLNSLNDNWFINLSSCTIPLDVQCLLQLGEKFGLPVGKSNLKKYIFDIIKFFETNIFKFDTLASQDYRNQFLHVLNNFLTSPLTHTDLENDILIKVKNTKKFLFDHPNLIITKADKGNVTVAMDKDTYIEKMQELLSDIDTYVKIDKDPTKKITNNLRLLLTRWLKSDYISIESYRKLLLSDGIIPRAYGLPKIHKQGTPLRIIVSSVNGPLHRFASFLHNILYEHLPKAKSHIKNSFELVEALNNSYIDDNYILMSLDVVSLFTNVPTDLIIGSVAKRWHHLNQVIDIPYNEFLLALNLVLDSTFFTFNKVTYRQVFGTPMGSPLSPILADLVMQDLEEHVLRNLSLRLPFYYRYVDDIALAAPATEIQSIVNSFNSFHHRLQFTSEVSPDNVLNFLDVSIIINNNRFEFDWYRKPTFSGRFLNFFSQHPVAHKRGVIIGLVDRAFKLSHPRYHTRNLDLIINILLTNGYPLKFVFDTTSKRLRSLIASSSVPAPSSSHNIQSTNVTPQAPSQNFSFFTIPYISNLSFKIADIVKDLNMNLSFVVNNRLNNFVKLHKDKLSTDNHLNIVYKINCNDCDASYVGQTGRQLSTRVKEHIANIRSVPSSHSVISTHRLNGHEFKWEEVSILDQEPFFRRRLFSEMLHIMSQKNSLNVQTDTALLDASYKWIINKFLDS